MGGKKHSNESDRVYKFMMMIMTGVMIIITITLVFTYMQMEGNLIYE